MIDTSKACILYVSNAWEILAPVGTEFRVVLPITRAPPDLDGKTSICNPDSHIAMLIPL
jgi:hypothetical protein